jgi:uncharacterized protein (UPF0218 family)
MENNEFVFICNNDKWNFFDNIEQEGHIESWKCTKSVKNGDKFYIHLGGNSVKEKGIIATGTVVSDPYIESNEYIDIKEAPLVVDLQIENIFDKAILKFKQGAYQVQASCGKVRKEIADEIKKNIDDYLAKNI